MTDVTAVAAIAERELVCNSGSVGPDTCRAWTEMPREDRLAFASAANFLGCTCEPVDAGVPPTIPQEHRVAIARLMLLKLGLYQCEPWWSSSVLDRLATTVLAFPGGLLSDLYRALYGLLGEYPCDLSPTMAAFIKDFVVKCFTQHRDSYRSVDWKAAAREVQTNSTNSQQYLALLAIPPEDLPSDFGKIIERGLGTTSFGQEVYRMLKP